MLSQTGGFTSLHLHLGNHARQQRAFLIIYSHANIICVGEGIGLYAFLYAAPLELTAYGFDLNAGG